MLRENNFRRERARARTARPRRSMNEAGALCNVTLLRVVASRLLCGGDVSAGALSPDLKTLTLIPPSRMTVTEQGLYIGRVLFRR